MGKRVCVFGSSIGYGHNDSEGGGWCDRLKRYYFGSDKDVSVYNLSVSGAMSKDVVARFDVEYGARRPAVVLIAIGMNDSMFNENTNDNQVSLSDTKKNIKQLITTIKKDGCAVALIGLTPITENLLSPVPWAPHLSYSSEDVQKYDCAIKEIAKDENVPYCYMYDVLQTDDLDDGLHPNTIGHQKMFERAKDFLEENDIV